MNFMDSTVLAGKDFNQHSYSGDWMKILICQHCGKKFICQGRATNNYLIGISEDCKNKKYCECDKCHPANKRDKYCTNIKYNGIEPFIFR
jgi:hypothetical protein